jgi:succinoglycan biosynthesis protein ExoV
LILKSILQKNVENIMKLHYFKGKSENFGDDINPWFWERILGNHWEMDNDDDYLIGIGTLVNDRLPQIGHLHILGSGAGYGRSVSKIKENWTAHFVRGPLTAKALGVETSRALIDPVFMLER